MSLFSRTNGIRFKTPIFCLLLVSVACWLAGCGSQFEVSIPKERVLSRVNQKFPMTKSVMMVMTVTLENPVIEFNGSKDCLDVTADVTVSAMGLMPTKGKTKISCKLVYRPEKKAIYLGNITVHELNMNGLPKGKHEEVIGLIGNVVVPTLASIEAYAFDSNSRLETLASAYVKGFRVTNDSLVVSVGGN